MMFFRLISALEGISYLVILSVSLGLISRDYVYPLGLTHGALFMAYLFASMVCSHKQKWSLVTWLLIFMAAFIPFAFVAVDFFLKKQSKITSN